MNRQYSRWEAIPEKTERDNFSTSIYAEGWKGLLIARCDQNGERPWLADLIVSAPKLKSELDFAKESAAAWEKNCKDAYAAQERADKELDAIKAKFSPENVALIKGCLDSLGVALSEHSHKWTEGERAIYEQAMELLK